MPNVSSSHPVGEISTTPSLAIHGKKQVQNANSRSKLPKNSTTTEVLFHKIKNFFFKKNRRFVKNNPIQFLLQVFIHFSDVALSGKYFLN